MRHMSGKAALKNGACIRVLSNEIMSLKHEFPSAVTLILLSLFRGVSSGVVYMLSLKAFFHRNPVDSTLRVVWMMDSLSAFVP